MTRRRSFVLTLILLPIALLCGLALSGVATASSTSSQHGTVTAHKPTIRIDMFAFKVPKKVAPGAKIVVKNMDGVAHSVTSDTSGLFDVTVAAGGRATFKAPMTAGQYAFHCKFHSSMHGMLNVKG